MRRLAAILDADVVGYSRLMSIDEAGTFEALKAHRRELIAPLIAEHQGRIVKLIGDGTLAEFASVVDALTCALQIQRAMIQRNEGIEPTRRMELRIGVHLGDVLVESNDIYGDGVNVAARLQEIAPPGGLCVSQQVHDQIAAKMRFEATDMGLQRLKNIASPVHVWRWTPDGVADHGDARPAGEASLLPHRNRPSLAVLPFANMSDVAEQEHFSDGFTEELIATLARCRWLFVAARNSSFTYKGRSVDVRKVAQDLGVRYVLEGSVRRAGSRIRITAQLLSGEDGTLLWAERYDRMLDDVFTLQDEIAAEITGTLEPELDAIEFAALRGRTVPDMNAWETYLKGLWHLYKFTLPDLTVARELLERAIVIDPGFAQAHARLAYVHIQLGWYGAMDDRAQRIRDALELSERAIALDEREPAAHLALGRARVLSGAAEVGIAHLRNALAMDPSFAQAHFALGQALCYVERPEEGIAEIREAFRLSPRDPHLWTFYTILAIAHYQAGRMEEATDAARSALRQANSTFWPAMILLAVLGGRGKAAETMEAKAELLRFRPGMTAATGRREFYFGETCVMPQSFVDRFIGDLEEAGLPAE
ncbi:adenylate/guanylate cyclase domain-containing protein [Rhizobium sp. RAF56]|jgi:TolB-like protein/class 3 adenylate cyclase/Tfp pilus assembly protein PilF|uniref:adenylate/guanylate cyclase domain-containing protein n=1 Tax=Rhizobium sp. RAF56 TaxID=3233062 RepID=UPI003F9E4960